MHIFSHSLLRSPLLAVAGGVVAVSFAAIFTKLTTAPPLVVALYRMSIAFLFQAPFLWRETWQELTQKKPQAVRSAVLAGLALGVHFAVWVTSLRLTSVASSTVLVTTQPVWVAVGSYLVYREKLPGKKIAALVLALTGVSLISVGDVGEGALTGTSLRWTGDLLAVLGAIFMACYLMLGREAQQNLGTGPYTFLAYGVAAATLLAMVMVHGDPLFPYPLADWLAFLGLALVCTLGGHSLLNWSLRSLSAVTVSSAILGEPVAATGWALLFLGEVPTWWQVAGGALVLIGLVWFNTADHRAWSFLACKKGADNREVLH